MTAGGYRVSSWDEENVLERDRGAGATQHWECAQCHQILYFPTVKFYFIYHENIPGNIGLGSQLFIFSYCRYFANEPFADFHRVEGLQGVYIATLINGSMNEENMRSVITFDKGGTWEFLQAPAFTGYGEKINCEVEMLSPCLGFSYKFLPVVLPLTVPKLSTRAPRGAAGNSQGRSGML